MAELVRAEGGGEGEGIFLGDTENRTGTVVQKHKTIKCRHTHGKQNRHNAHIYSKLAGKKMTWHSAGADWDQNALATYKKIQNASFYIFCMAVRSNLQF
jgi:hypothetical protein